MKKRNLIIGIILVLFIFVPRLLLDKGNENAQKEQQTAEFNKNKVPATPSYPLLNDKDEVVADEFGPLHYESGIKATEIDIPEPDFRVESVSEKEDHEIFYYPGADNYHILVTSSPFSSARDDAEKDFIAKLGISRQEACELNVVVNTVPWANPIEAGTNYPLSFCEFLIDTPAPSPDAPTENTE